MRDDLTSQLVMIDEPPPFSTTPDEWHAFLAELSPEAVPNSEQRAQLRRYAIRCLNWSIDRARTAEPGPPPGVTPPAAG